MTESEKEMFQAVQFLHNPPEWITLPQARIGTGYDTAFGGDRVIDAIAINMYPSRQFKTIAYEFKRTIKDFQADIRSPIKQCMMHVFCHEFYYVVTEEMQKKHGDELLQSTERLGDGYYVLKDNLPYLQSKAKTRHPAPWPQGLICSLIRNAYQHGKKTTLDKVCGPII